MDFRYVENSSTSSNDMVLSLPLLACRGLVTNVSSMLRLQGGPSLEPWHRHYDRILTRVRARGRSRRAEVWRWPPGLGRYACVHGTVLASTADCTSPRFGHSPLLQHNAPDSLLAHRTFGKRQTRKPELDLGNSTHLRGPCMRKGRSPAMGQPRNRGCWSGRIRRLRCGHRRSTPPPLRDTPSIH